MVQDKFDELVKGILESINSCVKEIILYGSVARGNSCEGSDIDIAVLVSDELTSEQNDKLSEFIVEMNLKYDVVFSVIDIDINKYEKWKNVLPFYKNVATEGIHLWKAA